MAGHIKGFFQALLSTFDSYSDMTWATLNAGFYKRYACSIACMAR